MKHAFLSFIILLFAVPAIGAYQAPDYPQKPALVASVSVTIPRTAALGSHIRPVCRIGPMGPIPRDARLFLYVSQAGKTYVAHVARVGEKPSIAIPRNIPTGEYSVEAGVFGERTTWQGRIRISGTPSRVLRKIITRGTFVDKEGVPHRWHINDAHTLIWDGVPWLPVGGMFIYDRNWDLVKAQLELLEKYGVKDIYLHLGVNQPYLWKDYSDDDYAYFQKTIDYLDDHGFRYGLEFQALESKGYSYPYPAGGPRVEITDSGTVTAEDKDVRSALYMVEDTATGDIVSHGQASVSDNKRMEVDVKVPGPGKYKVIFLPDKIDDGFVMYYWGGVYEKYRDRVLSHYGKVRLGKGFRFVADPLWNEMNTRHGLIPDTDDYRAGFEAWLKSRYGTVEKLNSAWRPRDGAFPDFASAASAVSMERVEDRRTKKLWNWVYDRQNGKLYALDMAASQFNYDVREYHGRALQSFCNRIADDFGKIADVPVIYKCFSDVDWWHINDTGSPDGHDGLGMESYGTGEPMLLFMGVHAYGELEQATKTTWLVVTETGEGNHQDASPSRNKGIGYTSRMGTMYANYNALLSGGAKGIFQYYMIGGRGVQEPWSDAVSRDPRQLEWLATYGRIVANASKLVGYKPPIYLRLPAHFNQHSMEIYSEPNSDFSNYGGWWWREPIGRSQNNVWIVPEVNMRADAAMHIVNLEKAPASERFASELPQAIRNGKRVTMIGFRHDLGTIPAVDKYYTDKFSQDADGRKFQVLKPTPTSRVLGKTSAGEVWNLIDGGLQINSKEVFPLHGYQPQNLLTGSEESIDPYYGMFDLMGVKLLNGGFSYLDNGERVTVLECEGQYGVRKLDFALSTEERIDGSRKREDGDKSVPSPFEGEGQGEGGTSRSQTRSLSGKQSGFQQPHSEVSIDARYPDGTPAGVVTNGKLTIKLQPQDTTLVRANLPWAPEGIMVNSLASREAVIIRGADLSRIIQDPELRTAANTVEPDSYYKLPPYAVQVEGEDAVAHNWNYGRMGAMPNLSRAACLAVETAVPPPADTGWYATYRFKAGRTADYQFLVRESLLSLSSPCDWRVDNGPWHHVDTSLPASDIRQVTFYNALEDTRQIFAWYHYDTVRIPAGEHTLTIRVTQPRGKNGLVTMADDRPFAKMIDCMVFTPLRIHFMGMFSQVRDSMTGLIPDPSVEFDENKDDKPDHWSKSEESDKLQWTKPGWGNYKVDGLVDINLGMRDSYTGQRALRIDPGPNERSWRTASIPAGPGIYQLSAYIRSTAQDPVKAWIEAVFYDASSKEIGGGSTMPVSESDWQSAWPAEGFIRAPKGTTHAVVSCVVSPGEGGSVWFDELVFARPRIGN